MTLPNLKRGAFQKIVETTQLIFPIFFIQNSKVDEWNNRVHMAATGDKYTIRALDSVIGANSPELRSKILNQIPLDPRKTKQLASNLQLAEGERTEIAWGK